MWCANFVKFGRQEVGEIVRYLPDQKLRLLSRCRYWADPAQNLTMYSECSRFHPNRITFGEVIPERVDTVKTRHKVFPIFG